MLLFSREDQFFKIAAFDNVYRGAQPAGVYLPPDQIAYTFASGQEHPFRMSIEYIAHETTHHLLRHSLMPADREPLRWVDEGLAGYISLGRMDKKGKFDPFKFEQGRQFEEGFQWLARGSVYLESFQKAAKTGTLPDLKGLLEGRVEKIDADLFYSTSWILVHYLMNGERGALRKPFLDWVTQHMGAPGDPGLAAALGRTPEQILVGLQEHAALLKQS